MAAYVLVLAVVPLYCTAVVAVATVVVVEVVLRNKNNTSRRSKGGGAGPVGFLSTSKYNNKLTKNPRKYFLNIKGWQQVPLTPP